MKPTNENIIDSISSSTKETTKKSNSEKDSLVVSEDSIFINDSISNDSLSINVVDTFSNLRKDTIITISQPPYMSGKEPQARINHPGHDSGIMILLSITFLLIAFNYNSYRRLLSTYAQSLWNVRRRANAFDEHTTNERSLIAILIFQLCVYAGILISSYINTIIPINPDKIMLTTCCMMGLYGLYYIFQLISFSIVGYVFSDGGGLSQWIKGFNASHIFLGFALIIPTVVSIFYPTTTSIMSITSMFIYVIVRLTFIFKGFRIFYNKVGSLFYFILYLCTLEFIPVFFVYGIAQIIIGNLQ